jgi:signal transduction histidine kinase
MNVDMMSQVPSRLPRGHRHALPDARRTDQDRLKRDIERASHNPVIDALLSAVDATLLVLNEQRQIVAFNSQIASLTQPSQVLGARAGEALGCVNARVAGGCGSAPACQTCGALGAVLACQQRGRFVEAEFLVRVEPSGGFEFNARATPVIVDDSRFVVLSLRDISNEKRREALEQIFFHDVLNTITGLRGWTELLRCSPRPNPGTAERIELLSRHLEREIRDHRSLIQAENGTLAPKLEQLRVADVLADVEVVFGTHSVARNRRLEQHVADELEVKSDPSLLLRVLVNMVRNALEATEPGGTVRVHCERVARARSGVETNPQEVAALFSVRNEGVIPPEVQDQIFKRSFSTKSQHGRGLGTYSMKLLGERYLGGKVSFVSNADSGTVFSLELPLGSMARPLVALPVW